MKTFLVVLLSTLSFSNAQIFPDIPGVTPKPWLGPIADHQIGIQPGDTPEVVAAKSQHLRAYKDALAVLPELPPEERFKKPELPVPAVSFLQNEAFQQLNHVHSPHLPVFQTHAHFEQPIVQPLNNAVTAPPRPTILAEEIPRSPIGEVPEVHAARVAHLKALEEARAALPPL